MKSAGWRSVAASVTASLLMLSPAVAQDSPALAGRPGDVVAVDGAATVFGKTWHGLIGIDLATKPGVYRVAVSGPTPGSITLRVLPKQFPVRRLRVSAAFVNPPAGALEEIAREAKKTAQIFDRITPRRWAGPFVLPVDGIPTSNFGTVSYFNGQRRSPHTGVDFLSATGTPIHASNHGIVALAEPLYFTGNTVIIDYGDGLYSLFAHLSEFRTREGDSVDPDTIVGLVGSTGRVTGPHLHWTVRLQGARVDPTSLVYATGGAHPH